MIAQLARHCLCHAVAAALDMLCGPSACAGVSLAECAVALVVLVSAVSAPCLLPTSISRCNVRLSRSKISRWEAHRHTAVCVTACSSASLCRALAGCWLAQPAFMVVPVLLAAGCFSQAPLCGSFSRFIVPCGALQCAACSLQSAHPCSLCASGQHVASERLSDWYTFLDLVNHKR